MAKVKAEDAPKVGSNNPFNDPFTEEMIARHEELDAEIQKIMLAAMLKCKDKRGDQRELMAEAKERGLSTKALRAHLRERALDRKKEVIREKLAPEQQDLLDLLKQHLGVLVDTPLGEAAIRQAEEAQAAA